MKKCFLVFIILATCFTLVGCSNLDNAITENICETNSTLLVGSNQIFEVNLLSGKIEEENVKNGIKTKLIDFTSITLSVIGEVESVSFAVKIDNSKKQYQLIKNPFNNTYSITINKNTDQQQLEICIIYEENMSKIMLNNVVDKKVQPLNIFIKEMKQELSELYFDKKFNGEVSIRFLYNYYQDNYYWYIACTRLDKSYFAIMIDSQNGNTLAKKH